MLNSIQNLVQIPANDQELNVLVTAMNRSYKKYFNLEVGPKKSNNLRDCYCESIGFTNGAYRQLQAYWSANNNYDFSDLEKNAVALLDDTIGGYNAVISSSISHQLIDYLCQRFPVDSNGFLSESQLHEDDFQGKYFDDPDAYWDAYGWCILNHDQEHQAVVNKEKDNKNWFPLYYGNVIIGHAFSETYALRLNGLLISAKQDKAINIHVPTINEDWNNYVSNLKETDAINPGKYLSLRMESMESSLYLPFDELIIEDNKVILIDGMMTLEFSLDKETSTLILEDNIRFDFVSAYSFGSDKPLMLAYGETDIGGNTTWSSNKREVEFIELFAFDRLEYRKLGDDDLSYYNNIEGAAFSVE